MADSAAQDEVLRGLADELAEQVARRYRISKDDARAVILEAWDGNDKLLEAAAGGASAHQLKRSRVYNDAATAAKKAIYYGLRRYRGGDDLFEGVAAALGDLPRNASADRLARLLHPVLERHVSTAERMGHIGGFFGRLFEAIGRATTILDVGCGALPLLFPFDGEGSSVELYCGADRDPKVIDVLSAYARWRGDGRLRARRWQISEGWPSLLEGCGCQTFDVALLLKLVPVVRRQQPELLGRLAEAPAVRLLVTGSRESMVRRANVERRELAAVSRFADQYGFERLQRFETEDEVGYLVERRMR
jgi:16S rRNA (guanine(1405)-N(7))-methyltransferase